MSIKKYSKIYNYLYTYCSANFQFVQLRKHKLPLCYEVIILRLISPPQTLLLGSGVQVLIVIFREIKK